MTTLNTVSLLTGFPGFLSSHLIPELLKRAPQTALTLLVLPQHLSLAKAKLKAIVAKHPELEAQINANITLIEGDITRERLGLTPDDYQQLQRKLHTVWHLAAIYDLSVSSHMAYRVNVTGTINILDLCQGAPSFERLNYVSTCYVSGKRTGMVYEHELDQQQAFKNHYEETKFWAEIELQRRMAQSGLKATIFRPGIVVGDSQTGYTDKYDGPYYLFKLLHRLPQELPLPQVGQGDAVVNLIPIDFAAAAMAYLGTQPEHIGQTFQIADPEPMRAKDIMALALKLLGRRKPIGALPKALVELALAQKSVESALQIPRETLEYFNHDARYDSSKTQRALVPAREIRCPHLSTYLGTLLQYMINNPDKSFLDERRI